MKKSTGASQSNLRGQGQKRGDFQLTLGPLLGKKVPVTRARAQAQPVAALDDGEEQDYKVDCHLREIFREILRTKTGRR